jgi:hypothetical protein
MSNNELCISHILLPSFHHHDNRILVCKTSSLVKAAGNDLGNGEMQEMGEVWRLALYLRKKNFGLYFLFSGHGFFIQDSILN